MHSTILNSSTGPGIDLETEHAFGRFRQQRQVPIVPCEKRAEGGDSSTPPIPVNVSAAEVPELGLSGGVTVPRQW